MSVVEHGKQGAWNKRLKLFTVMLLLVVFSFLGICYYLYHAEDPGWVERQKYLEVHKDEELMFLADVMARQILKKSNPFYGQEYVRRPERYTAGPQQIVISLEKLNAYMKVRLDQFLKRFLEVQIPKDVSGQMFMVNDENQLELKFKYTNKEIDQVISLVFEIEITKDGVGKLYCVGARAGRLPVPIGLLVSNFKKHFEPKYGMTQLIDGNDGQMGMRFEPLYQTRHHRDQVRVTGITFRKLDITIDYHFEAIK